MLLVIVGAGASYDSASSYPTAASLGLDSEKRPPLANELFQNRETFAHILRRDFPQCQPLVTRLRDTPRVQVEQLLAEFQSEAELHPVRYQQLAAIRFYIQRVIQSVVEDWSGVHNGVTNYKTLLDDLERWRLALNEKICIVTFNYDLMIEEALPQVGVKIASMNDYVANDSYKLIKLHGSVNWSRLVKSPSFDEVFAREGEAAVIMAMISQAKELALSDDVVYALPGFKELSLQSRSLFPAIAIPVVEKSDFECPAAHLKVLRTILSTTTKILAIGWRGTERHFLKLFKENQRYRIAPVMVVAANENEAKEIGFSLSQAGVGGSFYNGKGGFTAALINREINRFLWEH